MHKMDIGISEQDRKEMVTQLSVLLADSYTLYLQTHNFHWNVTGPLFRDLHLMFEEHYTELATAVDDIAERIRALGEFAPGTYKVFSELSSIEEHQEIPSAQAMIEVLVQSHEVVIKTARKALKLAQQIDDESSSSLVSDRLSIHEKTVWMLRSIGS